MGESAMLYRRHIETSFATYDVAFVVVYTDTFFVFADAFLTGTTVASHVWGTSRLVVYDAVSKCAYR